MSRCDSHALRHALQFVSTREKERYRLSSFECVGLDEIEREQKCIHPIETADFCAVLYKWELSVYF